MTTINAQKLKFPLFIKLASAFLLLLFFYGIVCLIFGVDKIKFVYGLGSHRNIFIDALIVVIFLAKAILTYGYLTGKHWSIKFGIIDALAGIVIYLIATSIPFIEYDPAFPNYRAIGTEILILIPYLYTLLYFNKKQKLAGN